MGQLSDALVLFVERGGPVFVAILFLSVVMWTLILERYWYYHRALVGLRAVYLSPLKLGGGRIHCRACARPWRLASDCGSHSSCLPFAP